MERKRGRPPGDKPPKSAAQRMREYRARRRSAQIAASLTPEEIAALPTFPPELLAEIAERSKGMFDDVKPFPPELLAEIEASTAAMLADLKPLPQELLDEIAERSKGMFDGVKTVSELLEAQETALRAHRSDAKVPKP